MQKDERLKKGHQKFVALKSKFFPKSPPMDIGIGMRLWVALTQAILLEIHIARGQGRGEPLESFLSTSFGYHYVLSLIGETSCLAVSCLPIASFVALDCDVR